MDKRKLKGAIKYTEKKCNFHCKTYPERKGCEGCEIDNDCDKELITWNCDFNLNFFLEGLYLQAVKPKKVVEYLEWSRNHGGHCDCEVILNAKMHLPNNEHD